MKDHKHPISHAHNKGTSLSTLLPRYSILPLIVAVVWNAIAYYGGRAIAQSWPHYIFESAIDHQIPFLPWTVSIYYASYIFWIVNYILCARQEKEKVYRFLSADFLAKGVCLLCFLLLPTTNTRPVVEPEGFWNSVMVLLYRADAADNLFPSIHCLTSWFCYIGLREYKQIPKWYRNLSFWMAVAVFISTLTTKQHIILDVFGGALLAQFCYWVTERIHFSRLYGNVFDSLSPWISGGK